MRAGKMDTTITVQRFTSVIDEGGGSVQTWTDLATVRAQIIQASTEEFIRSYGASDDTIMIFRTRWIDDIKTADRVIHDGEAFNIKELKPIGRQRGLDIRAVA
jgi:SPP1 family predicted phage head-tail adaptor